MTEKIRLEIEDGASPGLDSIDKKIEELGRDADKATKETEKLANAADDVGKKGKDLDRKWNLTNLNQGMELLKKGIGLASRSLQQLAADGNPAFIELQKSITGVQNALLDVASDPEIQGLASSLSEGINKQLIPAIKSIPDYWRSAQDSVAAFTASAGEAIGVFEKGTVDTLKEIQIEEAKALDLAKEAARVAEQRAMVEEKLAAIRTKLGEQQELIAMAQLSDERLIQQLIDEETEQLKELAKEGRATAEQREASLKKIELLERRLIEVQREEFDANIKAQEEASQARFEAQQKANEYAEKMAEKARQAAEEEAKAVREAEEQKRLERDKTRQAQEDALLKAGGGAVAQARAQLDPRAVREQIARQRMQEAETAGGGAAEIAAARRGAFQAFNRGAVGGEEIGRAQNALLEGQIQQAQKRGQVDSQHAQLLSQVVNSQQTAAAQQEAFAQQLQQLQSAMSNVNQAQGRTRQRFQAAGVGR